MNPYFKTGLFILVGFSCQAFSEEVIDLDTTTIKGNTELPKTMFVVPWQDTKTGGDDEDRKLVLHNLYGDLFDPILPKYIPDSRYQLKTLSPVEE